MPMHVLHNTHVIILEIKAVLVEQRKLLKSIWNPDIILRLIDLTCAARLLFQCKASSAQQLNMLMLQSK
jgi:hypothetical protein